MKSLLALITFFCLSSAHAATDYPKIARGALYYANPNLDFTSQQIKPVLKNIESDLESIFNTFLDTTGAAAFSRTSTPYAEGELIIAFKDQAVIDALNAIRNGNTTIDLTLPIGVSDLDAINAQYSASALELLYSPSTYMLKLPNEQNLSIIATKYMALSSVEYAEPNYLIGDGPQIELLSLDPNVYLFTYGWGDCPSGCINKNRTYFESYGDEITKIGETGDTIPQGTKLYK